MTKKEALEYILMLAECEIETRKECAKNGEYPNIKKEEKDYWKSARILSKEIK